ncbi:MAG: SGNH/GDSL hydrolase family protein [Fimbriiglobus sp.]
MRCFGWLLGLILIPGAVQAGDPWKFTTGDRVVIVGSTLIEREQKYAHWEEALHFHNPGIDIKFRNLGWSGDTVFGEARAGFDPVPKGYQRLVQLTTELKPTVIVLCYGFNESFAGQSGEAGFRKQYEKLLQDLSPTKARLVLMSPIPMEPSSGRPVVTEVNESLARYVGIIESIAKEKKLDYVPLFERAKAAGQTLTENGLHPDEDGYRRLTPLLFETSPPSPSNAKIRVKIIDKNQLFFHRWRPQNETYLFGFRKHEQGNNSVEIPQFDPLIEKAEAEISTQLKSVGR